ncbi:hypothetical protein [Aerosakkonema funiforme]|uniref:Uncharacterized protein n=2 Tax=Oscillatoriophycideae TaxID=1301283 RepID=A0A926VJ61_9CYAN|nr:hypothetical protein [Aerosakkonema funiforme]MBD2184158.1 hypothetical protein [Aerosakkonema funiforme FACHB-1375]
MNTKWAIAAIIILYSLGWTNAAKADELSQDTFNLPSTSSNSRATSSSAGTTVNQQQNTQVNNNQFYGFGPGISCPSPTLGLSMYGGLGNGSGSDAEVSSTSIGAVASINIPLGGSNARTCRKIGEAQLRALQAQTERANLEAAKIRTDITLVTINQCIQIMRNARLSGQFAEVCSGIELISPNPNNNAPAVQPVTVPQGSQTQPQN